MGDKYYVLTDLGMDGLSLDVFDTKDELQDFLKRGDGIKNVTIIEGRKLIPEYKFYFKLEKEETE